MKKVTSVTIRLLLLVILLVTGCAAEQDEGQSLLGQDGTAQHQFHLRTAMVDGRVVFTGAGGDIDGVVNPDLTVAAGGAVTIILENGDGMLHDLAIPDLAVQTATVQAVDAVVTVTFTPESEGTYRYYCTIAGHRQAGMEGTLIVTPTSVVAGS